MSKIIIIGAGISGLSIAQMLKNKNEVILFETADRPGGLIKCDKIKGCLFHRTGGHVFNTKREDVLSWFWSFFDKEKEFTKATRNAIISMSDGKIIPYPIENHIYLLGDKIQSIIHDLITNLTENKKIKLQNFEEFLQNRFGKTLCDIYFKPYNEKIWKTDLLNIPLSWLEGKLPMPTISEIIYNNINRMEEQNFVHSSFYYPVKNGSQYIADRLANGLDIRFKTTVYSVKKDKTKWIVNGIEADKIIFCGNIKQIPTLLSSQIDFSAFVKSIEELDSHGTTAVFCEIQHNPYSWVYMPGKEHESHRIICTGNFAEANRYEGKMTATVEFTDEMLFDEIEKNLRYIPLSPKYLTHYYEKYTYPIQDKSTREMIFNLKQKLEVDNFYMTGRFADWEYYNMDAAIGAALDLYNRCFIK